MCVRNTDSYTAKIRFDKHKYLNKAVVILVILTRASWFFKNVFLGITYLEIFVLMFCFNTKCFIYRVNYSISLSKNTTNKQNKRKGITVYNLMTNFKNIVNHILKFLRALFFFVLIYPVPFTIPSLAHNN